MLSSVAKPSGSIAGYEYAYCPALLQPSSYRPELSVWTKLGDQSAHNVTQLKKLGDEATITASKMISPKFVLVGMIGEAMRLRHKHGKFNDVLVRPYRKLFLLAQLVAEDKAAGCFDVSFDSGSANFTVQMKNSHNIGYGTVLAREFLGLAPYIPIIFPNLHVSEGRCNMLKALKHKGDDCKSSGSKVMKHALKRPAAK